MPPAVGKALLVLDAFRVSGHTVGVSRLAEVTGLSKSTVHRLLGQLGEAGYVTRSGSSYRLGVRVFELGSSYIHCTEAGLVQIAGPHLSGVFLRVQAIVTLTVLDGDDVVLLDAIQSPRFPLRSPSVGSRVPALATAAGKAICAFLPEDEAGELLRRRTRLTPLAPPTEIVERQMDQVRETGIAVAVHEMREDVVSVSSPVLVGEHPIAAISASAPSGRLDVKPAGEAVLRAGRMVAQDFIHRRRELQDYGPASPHHDLLNEE